MIINIPTRDKTTNQTEKRECEEQQWEERKKQTRVKLSSAKEKKGFRPKFTPILTKDNEELIINEKDLLQAWQEHFKILLNIHQDKEHREKVYQGVDPPVEDPTNEETLQVIKKL